MRRRDDHAAVGTEFPGEQRDRRRGDDAGEQGVCTTGHDAGHERRLEHVAAAPRVATHHDAAPTAVAEEVAGSLAQPERQLGSQVVVRNASYAVGAEEPPHVMPLVSMNEARRIGEPRSCRR